MWVDLVFFIEDIRLSHLFANIKKDSLYNGDIPNKYMNKQFYRVKGHV